MSYIRLKTYDGRHYLGVENGGPVTAVRSWAAEWETFRAVPVQGGTIKSDSAINLCSHDGMHYVCAEGGGGQRNVNASRLVPAQWETFQIHRIDGAAEIADGCRVSLRTYNGHYLCAENGGGGEVVADRTVPAEWESFTVEPVPLRSLFPLKASGTKEVRSHEYVSGVGMLGADGLVNAEMHVWTTNKTYGFRGACAMLAVDEANQVLWHGRVVTHGVDGLWIPGLPSSRQEIWDERVPDEIMTRTAALRVSLFHNPRSMLDEDLDTAIGTGKKLAELGKILVGLVALF
jgi:hypothetical protein